MTALRPGQSPPPVRMPIRFTMGAIKSQTAGARGSPSSTAIELYRARRAELSDGVLWHSRCSTVGVGPSPGRTNLGGLSMSILGWLLFGLIVGVIAKFLMPGRDPGGWIVTILLGIAGSFVGGFLATTLMGRQEQTAGWIGSIIGAMILLFLYRIVAGRRTVV